MFVFVCATVHMHGLCIAIPVHMHVCLMAV